MLIRSYRERPSRSKGGATRASLHGPCMQVVRAAWVGGLCGQALSLPRGLG